MIVRNYETVAGEFFEKLADADERLQALFQEMNFVRTLKSAREMNLPVTDGNAWLQGQISICDEYLNRYRMACEAREASANAEREEQFQKGGLG